MGKRGHSEEEILRVLREAESGDTVVAGTTADRRADEVGLQTGDVIHSVNAKPVANLDTLRMALRRLKPGDAAALQVERDGRMTFVTFEIE